MRLAALLLLVSASLAAKVNVTTLAAGTTIAINVLEIRQTIRKAKEAAKVTRGVAVRVARKVVR